MQHNQATSFGRTLLEIIILAILYFATARFGQVFAIPPGNVTSVWLPSGIILAAVLWRGTAIWPGIWFGAFAGNVWAYLDWENFSNLGVSFISGSANGVGDTLCALVGARLILRFADNSRPFCSVRQVFVFICGGAMLGGAISAVFGVTGLAAVGLVPWEHYTYVWLTWWVGDVVGVVLVAPLLLLGAHWWQRQSWGQPFNLREFLVFSVALILVAALALELVPGSRLPVPLFIVIPVLLWGALRFPMPVSLAGSVLVAVLAISMTAGGAGPFFNGDMNKALLDLQLFVFTMLTTILLVVGVFEERKSIEKGLLETEESYRRLFDKAAGGIVITDAQGCVQSFNVQAEVMFGYQARDVEGRNIGFLLANPPADLNSQLFSKSETLNGAKFLSEGGEILARRSNGDKFPVFVALSTIHEQDDSARQYLAVIHDLSAMKQLESDVKVSEEKFKLLSEAAGDAILILNRNIVERVNCEFENLFGYDACELVGGPLQTKLFATDLVFMDGQERAVISEGIRKQGGRFPIEVSQKSKVIDAELLKVICIRDRSEQQQQLAQISRAEQDLEKSKQLKAQMLAAMSHELRPSVNSILGFSQLIDMEAQQMPERQREAVVEINSAAKDLLALVEAYFDLAKIESGTFVVAMDSVDIVPVISECVDLVKPLAQQRGIKIFNHLPAGSRYFVCADEVRLKQVFLNLMTNAVKFNHADGTVTVSVEPTLENRLRVSITDSGIGLTDDEQETLFEPFLRQKSERDTIKSAGVGLAIAKKLVELMGGAIGLESYKYMGSTFWLELELRMEALTSVRELTAVENGRRKGDAGVSSAHKTVLYVKGHSVTPRLIEMLVENFSEVRLVGVPVKQLEHQLMAEDKLHLILLDIDLDEANGGELLCRVCELTRQRKIPVLVLGLQDLESLACADDSMENAFDLVTCFAKPIELERLAQVIRSGLSDTAKSAS